jgi:two-component system sensor histidine kinase SenX3
MKWWNKRVASPQAVLQSGVVEGLKALSIECMVLPSLGSNAFFTDGLVNYGLIRDNRIQSEELLALIRVVRRTGKRSEKIIAVSRGPLSNETHDFLCVVSQLDSDGTVLVLLNDETESTRVDAMRRDFITNVSHELKTPISAIGLLADSVVASKDQPELVEKWGSRMQSESKRLQNLVQEIIDLSRLQDTDPMDGATEVNIEDAIRQAINQATVIAESKNISVVEGGHIDAYVMGKPEHLVMAIHNLIENAINYSASGTKVTISSSKVNGIIEVTVVDQGIGIPDSELERIFERFYRVDPARSRESGGTGLGLSIVKHVAANHGGEIKVWSSVGVGSTFALRLPEYQGGDR